jgi:hypothetical protein
MASQQKKAEPMASPDTHASPPASEQPAWTDKDPLDEIMPMIPFVIPIVGGVLIFLLAMIAVTMA